MTVKTHIVEMIYKKGSGWLYTIEKDGSDLAAGVVDADDLMVAINKITRRHRLDAKKTCFCVKG